MLYQGDNTQAFNGNFVKINAVYKDKDGNIQPMPPLMKAEARTGCIVKVYENPTFPLYVNFDEKESEKLNIKNILTLAVWDMKGRKKTANGKLEFTTKPRSV